MKRILPAMLFLAVFAAPAAFTQPTVRKSKNHQVFTKGTTQVKLILAANGSLIGVTTFVFEYRSGELVRYDCIRLIPSNAKRISGPAIKALVKTIFAQPFKLPGSLLMISHETGIIEKSADGKIVVKVVLRDDSGKVLIRDTNGPEIIPDCPGVEPLSPAPVPAWPVWKVPALVQPEEFSGDGI